MFYFLNSALRAHKLDRAREGRAQLRIFLNWVKYSSRSETLATALQAELFYVAYLQKKRIWCICLRYICASIHTIAFLLWRRPKVVLVMNQPVFLPMLVYLLSFVLRFKYVIDSHSGLFTKRAWYWAQPLMRHVCKRSFYTIVTNSTHKSIVEQWGAKVVVLGTMIVADKDANRQFIGDRQSIVVIGSFADDEPTLEILRAASLCPDVQFYVTGDYRTAKPAFETVWPRNVTFTGFLKREEYIGLVKSVDGAMILVTTDNTMQRGAYEAMSWGTPIITSDWPLLRKTFPKGAIFVGHHAVEIARGVATFMATKDLLRHEIQNLKAEKEHEWQGWVQDMTTKLEMQAG